MAARRKVAESGATANLDEPLPSLTLKDLDPSERPRERLMELGPYALTNAELLAILLRTGIAGLMVTDLARMLLKDYGGLTGLLAASPQELAMRRGLGPAKAAQLKAALEVGRRLLIEELEDRPKVSAPDDLARLVQKDMEILEQEQLRIFLLDTKNRVIGVRTLYQGSLNQSTVRVGEIFRHAIRESCASIAVAHNHPSGDPTPSPEDVRVTQAIVEAGKLLDIDVIDHVIIGRGRVPWVSLRQRGLGFRT